MSVFILYYITGILHKVRFIGISLCYYVVYEISKDKLLLTSPQTESCVF